MRTFGLLLSSASLEIADDLVSTRGASLGEATSAAELIRRAQPGVRVSVMVRDGVGGWRQSGTGRGVREALDWLLNLTDSEAEDAASAESHCRA